MSLLEYLDRTGKHVSAKTFNKYRDEKHSFFEWSALNILNNITRRLQRLCYETSYSFF